ncbi:uncharacterized protein PG998_008299 [Apiospora kogelbergensis]|uniref:uncharacterized protein n=1 Tax=Apiospora kogelbergensis TaxID=1337665 RepID=UPI003131C741
MGRLGPLTSQALGRSPYDDVVMGTGLPDPREGPRQYDEKGRVVNPNTKSVIKSMIRAHNEVMHVIGVAEPDDPSTSGLAESRDTASSLVQDQLDYENTVAQVLIPVGRMLADVGLWALEGVRQRSLVYKPYCHTEFSRLWQFELTNRTNAQMALVGLQVYFPARAVEGYFKYQSAFVQARPWLVAGLKWFTLNVEIFTILQTLDVIPSSAWLPSPLFFVPFSSASPFVAPPRMETINASSIATWTSQLAVNVAPYAAFYLMKRLIGRLNVGTVIFRLLPRSRRGSNNAAAAAAASAGDQGIPLGTLRRHSTFSNRGATGASSGAAAAAGSGDQDYGTDEEDTDMINPTLISFDVDTSETTEPPAGVWSAELRPSYSGQQGGAGAGENNNRSSYASTGSNSLEKKLYMVTPLTLTPTTLAADSICRFLVNAVCAPAEALLLRAMARNFLQSGRQLLFSSSSATVTAVVGMDLILPLNLWDFWSWRRLGNILGIGMLQLLINAEIWTFMTVISQSFHVSEEVWRELREEEEAEEAEEAAEERERELEREVELTALRAVAASERRLAEEE